MEKEEEMSPVRVGQDLGYAGSGLMPTRLMVGTGSRDCGCTTLLGLTTESGTLVEMMLLGSVALNLYLAFCPPAFCLLLENGWLKAFRVLLEGKTTQNCKGEKEKELKEGKCVSVLGREEKEELPLPEVV
jgi:hypothetical protein